MTIIAELSYLEFHNTKEKLASGFYRVVEADGDLSYAWVKANDSNSSSQVKWVSEDEYVELRRQDYDILDDWDMHYITANDMDEALVDSWDYAMGRSENIVVADVADATDGIKIEKSLGDILREFKDTDVRDMSESQYAEHCEVADQNRRDGV